MQDKINRIKRLEQEIKKRTAPAPVVVINAGDPIPPGAQVVIIDDVPPGNKQE